MKVVATDSLRLRLPLESRRQRHPAGLQDRPPVEAVQDPRAVVGPTQQSVRPTIAVEVVQPLELPLESRRQTHSRLRIAIAARVEVVDQPAAVVRPPHEHVVAAVAVEVAHAGKLPLYTAGQPRCPAARHLTRACSEGIGLPAPVARAPQQQLIGAVAVEVADVLRHHRVGSVDRQHLRERQLARGRQVPALPLAGFAVPGQDVTDAVAVQIAHALEHIIQVVGQILDETERIRLPRCPVQGVGEPEARRAIPDQQVLDPVSIEVADRLGRPVRVQGERSVAVRDRREPVQQVHVPPVRVATTQDHLGRLVLRCDQRDLQRHRRRAVLATALGAAAVARVDAHLGRAAVPGQRVPQGARVPHEHRTVEHAVRIGQDRLLEGHALVVLVRAWRDVRRPADDPLDQLRPARERLVRARGEARGVVHGQYLDGHRRRVRQDRVVGDRVAEGGGAEPVGRRRVGEAAVGAEDHLTTDAFGRDRSWRGDQHLVGFTTEVDTVAVVGQHAAGQGPVLARGERVVPSHQRVVPARDRNRHRRRVLGVTVTGRVGKGHRRLLAVVQRFEGIARIEGQRPIGGNRQRAAAGRRVGRAHDRHAVDGGHRQRVDVEGRVIGVEAVPQRHAEQVALGNGVRIVLRLDHDQLVNLVDGRRRPLERVAEGIGDVLINWRGQAQGAREGRQVAARDLEVEHGVRRHLFHVRNRRRRAAGDDHVRHVHVPCVTVEGQAQHQRVRVGGRHDARRQRNRQQHRSGVVERVGLVGGGFGAGQGVAGGIGNVLAAGQVETDDAVEAGEIAAGEGHVEDAAAGVRRDARDGGGGCAGGREVAGIDVLDVAVEGHPEGEGIGVGGFVRGHRAHEWFELGRRVVHGVSLVGRGGGFGAGQGVAGGIGNILAGGQVETDDAVEAGEIAAGEGHVEDAAAGDGRDARDDGSGSAGDREVARADVLDVAVEGHPEGERIGVGGLVHRHRAHKRFELGRGVVHGVSLVGRGGGFGAGQGVAGGIGNILAGGQVETDDAVEAGEIAAGEGHVEDAAAGDGRDARDDGSGSAGDREVARADVLDVAVEGHPEGERIGVGGLVRRHRAHERFELRRRVIDGERTERQWRRGVADAVGDGDGAVPVSAIGQRHAVVWLRQRDNGRRACRDGALIRTPAASSDRQGTCLVDGQRHVWCRVVGRVDDWRDLRELGLRCIDGESDERDQVRYVAGRVGDGGGAVAVAAIEQRCGVVGLRQRDRNQPASHGSLIRTTAASTDLQVARLADVKRHGGRRVVGRAGNGNRDLERGRFVVERIALVRGRIVSGEGVAGQVLDVLAHGEVEADGAAEAGQISTADGDVVERGADHRGVGDGRGGRAVDGEVRRVDVLDVLGERRPESERVGVRGLCRRVLAGEALKRRRAVVERIALVRGRLASGKGIAGQVLDVLAPGEVEADGAVEAGQIPTAESHIVGAGADRGDVGDGGRRRTVDGEVRRVDVLDVLGEGRPESERIGVRGLCRRALAAEAQ